MKTLFILGVLLLAMLVMVSPAMASRGGHFGGHFGGGHFRHFGGPHAFIGGFFGYPYYAYPYWGYPYGYPYPYDYYPAYPPPDAYPDPGPYAQPAPASSVPGQTGSTVPGQGF